MKVGRFQMPEPIIKIENVDYYYQGRVKALENIRLNIYKSEIVRLVGQNGSRKFTFGKAESGFEYTLMPLR